MKTAVLVGFTIPGSKSQPGSRLTWLAFNIIEGFTTIPPNTHNLNNLTNKTGFRDTPVIRAKLLKLSLKFRIYLPI